MYQLLDYLSPLSPTLLSDGIRPSRDGMETFAWSGKTFFSIPLKYTFWKYGSDHFIHGRAQFQWYPEKTDYNQYQVVVFDDLGEEMISLNAKMRCQSGEKAFRIKDFPDRDPVTGKSTHQWEHERQMNKVHMWNALMQSFQTFGVCPAE